MMINDLDRVEILTLQDNYIDMTATDNSAMIRRAGARVAGETRKSVLAEHGFSAVIRTTVGDRTRTKLFDFGFSEIGAAFNARTLGVPMGEIEAIALSHSHGDHMGGFHLNVAPTDPVVGRTVEALRKIGPRYIVPTHCTGRKSIQHIEAAMPESFLLNMAGTRLTFAA